MLDERIVGPQEFVRLAKAGFAPEHQCGVLVCLFVSFDAVCRHKAPAFITPLAPSPFPQVLCLPRLLLQDYPRRDFCVAIYESMKRGESNYRWKLVAIPAGKAHDAHSYIVTSPAMLAAPKHPAALAADVDSGYVTGSRFLPLIVKIEPK